MLKDAIAKRQIKIMHEIPGIELVQDFESRESMAELRKDWIHKADTIRELALKMGKKAHSESILFGKPGRFFQVFRSGPPVHRICSCR
jgi:hypothetical protein